jgi:hypothetical protein
MRSLSAANATALADRRLVARDFLTLWPRVRATGAPQMVAWWSDYGDVSAEVVDPDTGLAVTRAFAGRSGLISIDDIPLVHNVTVQRVTIRLSAIEELAEQAVRLYDAKQAAVQIHRGLFDPATRLVVAPAFCRFVGFVDLVRIETPEEGGEGAMTLTCVSHTQEMTRANPATRSDADQRLRSATDEFFLDAATIGEVELFWGKERGKLA